MKRFLIPAAIGVIALALPSAYADDDNNNNVHTFQVVPFTFDPANTNLVGAGWFDGAGCPTKAQIAAYPSTHATGTYTDPACPTGDPKDKNVQGLILVKTGPTINNASAGANLNGVKNVVLTELGYDIRNGSHCDADSPRFNITTTTGKFYFLACNSPAPTTIIVGNGWMRRRWGAGTPGTVMGYLNGAVLLPITDPIKSISILTDEGDDVAPKTGLAILDNIDVNGVLVGQGPKGSENNSDDEGKGPKKDK